MCNTHLRSKAQTGNYLHTAVLTDIVAIISIITSFLFPSARKTEAGGRLLIVCCAKAKCVCIKLNSFSNVFYYH